MERNLYILYFLVLLMNTRAFLKKWVEPFLAIGIFIMLILVVYGLYLDRELKNEISENCGFGEEDYFCYCEKSEAMRIKNLVEEVGGIDLEDLILKNVSMDW